MIQESLNSITALLAEQLDRTNDEPFRRSLAVRVDTWRSKLLNNSLEKRPNQRKQFWQTLWVPMQKVTPVPGIQIKLPNIAQSIRELPLALRGNTQYDYVGGVNGRAPFRPGVVGTTDFLRSGKYSHGVVYYELVNQFLRLEGINNTVPMVRVDGVFDKPTDVMEFNKDAGVDCDGWDKPYPVTGDILQSIIQYILQVDYNRQDKPVQQTEVSNANP